MSVIAQVSHDSYREMAWVNIVLATEGLQFHLVL